MSRIVRMTSEDPISPESIERLKHLAEMPDELINISDIAECTEEQFATARARQKVRARQAAETLHKKAS